MNRENIEAEFVKLGNQLKQSQELVLIQEHLLANAEAQETKTKKVCNQQLLELKLQYKHHIKELKDNYQHQLQHQIQISDEKYEKIVTQFSNINKLLSETQSENQQQKQTTTVNLQYILDQMLQFQEAPQLTNLLGHYSRLNQKLYNMELQVAFCTNHLIKKEQIRKLQVKLSEGEEIGLLHQTIEELKQKLRSQHQKLEQQDQKFQELSQEKLYLVKSVQENQLQLRDLQNRDIDDSQLQNQEFDMQQQNQIIEQQQQQQLYLLQTNTQVEQLQKAVDSVQTQLNQQLIENINLQAQLNESNVLNFQMQEELSNLAQKVMYLQEDRDQLAAGVEFQRRDLQQAEQRALQAQSQTAAQQNQIQQLSNGDSSNRERYLRLKQEIAFLQQENIQKQRKIDDLMLKPVFQDLNLGINGSGFNVKQLQQKDSKTQQKRLDEQSQQNIKETVVPVLIKESYQPVVNLIVEFQSCQQQSFADFFGLVQSKASFMIKRVQTLMQKSNDILILKTSSERQIKVSFKSKRKVPSQHIQLILLELNGLRHKVKLISEQFKQVLSVVNDSVEQRCSEMCQSLKPLLYVPLNKQAEYQQRLAQEQELLQLQKQLVIQQQQQPGSAETSQSFTSEAGRRRRRQVQKTLV